jgi:hypothetical protein
MKLHKKMLKRPLWLASWIQLRRSLLNLLKRRFLLFPRRIKRHDLKTWRMNGLEKLSHGPAGVW